MNCPVGQCQCPFYQVYCSRAKKIIFRFYFAKKFYLYGECQHFIGDFVHVRLDFVPEIVHGGTIKHGLLGLRCQERHTDDSLELCKRPSCSEIGLSIELDEQSSIQLTSISVFVSN